MEPPTHRFTRTTRGRRQHARYGEEYQLATIQDNSKRELTAKNELETVEHIIGVIFMQYSMQVGLQRFKKKSEDALQQELQQLLDMEVFVPIQESCLTAEQKQKALSMVTFIKKKCDNQVKGRVCADRRKQR